MKLVGPALLTGNLTSFGRSSTSNTPPSRIGAAGWHDDGLNCAGAADLATALTRGGLAVFVFARGGCGRSANQESPLRLARATLPATAEREAPSSAPIADNGTLRRVCRRRRPGRAASAGAGPAAGTGGATLFSCTRNFTTAIRMAKICSSPRSRPAAGSRRLYAQRAAHRREQPMRLSRASG